MKQMILYGKAEALRKKDKTLKDISEECNSEKGEKAKQSRPHCDMPLFVPCCWEVEPEKCFSLT